MHDPLHYSLDFDVPPERVYRALTDGAEFAAWSGAPASIGAAEGDAFSCFDGWILGRHVELVPGVRIVQAWRVKNWPEGVYSTVRFELSPQGRGTRLEAEHAGFPAEHRVHLEPGWGNKYWGPLGKWLAASGE